MARRKVLATLAFIALLSLIVLIPPSSADNAASISPPSQCSKFIPGGGNTNHFATVTDFLGNVRSTYGLGESVNVHANASSSVGDTDVNRVRFVWIDPVGVIIQTPVIPRGSQSASSWSLVAGLTAGSSGSTNPVGMWTVILCYETPNNTMGRGVTHHIDVATYNVIW